MTEETNNTTRQSRESENHANNTRRKPWTPVRKLETPEPPEGYEYRWIRESMLGQEDRSNVGNTNSCGKSVPLTSSQPSRNLLLTLLLTSSPCLLYTSPSPRDGLLSRMPSSA